MSGTVLHFLTETDSFSDLHGAALQRWVANVLRFEEGRAVVACARADASWGLAQVRTVLLPGLWAYSKLKGRYRLPWSVRRPMLRKILRPALAGLNPDSVVWIHNRPDYAAAIEADVRATGAKLIVHLHNSLLVSFPCKITASFRADRLVFCSRYLENEAKSVFPALDRTSVVYNGADESRFYPRPQRKAWSWRKRRWCSLPAAWFLKRARTFLLRRCGYCGRAGFKRADGCWERPDSAQQMLQPDIRARSLGTLRQISSSADIAQLLNWPRSFAGPTSFARPRYGKSRLGW